MPSVLLRFCLMFVPMVIVGGSAVGRAQMATDFRWRQVLTSHRIADRFTAIDVNPQDPRHIFVGTQAGTIFRTRDGGVTWQEFPLAPSNIEPRSVGIPRPNLQVQPAPFLPQFSTELEDQESDQDRLGGPFVDLSSPAPQAEAHPASRRNIFGDALSAMLTPRTAEALPVQYIDYCPGGRYPLLVATDRDVFASDDDGRTFIRLFQLTQSSEFVEPGIVPISQIICSPSDPNEILVTSNRGLLWSTDGGLTFTEYIVGGVAGPVTAVAFDDAAAEAGQHANMLVGQESLLFIGDPTSREGLVYTYPLMNALGTAPWSFVRWITVTPSAQIWMATDNGPRASLDGGVSWFKPGSRIFNQDPTKQIHLGYSHTGGERIAVVQQDAVWTSDDNARTWMPFFRGVSRRSNAMVAAAPPDEEGFAQWWVLTSGELWTNKDPTEGYTLDPRQEVQEWAEERIARTRPLWTVLHNAYRRLHVRTEDIEHLIGNMHRRNWAPILEVNFEWTDDAQMSLLRSEGAPIFQIDMNRAEQGWVLFAQATWDLSGTIFSDPTRVHSDLISVQREVGFVVEDAWHERMNALLRLAEGQTTVFQTEVLRERVMALEGVLSVWLGDDFFRAHEDER